LLAFVVICTAQFSLAADPPSPLPPLESYLIPELEGAEPHVMLEAAIGALRANDLNALIQISGGEKLYTELESEWSQQSASTITDKDRAEFESLRQMFASEEAEEQLMAMLEPQLAGLKEQMDGLIALVQMMAAEKLDQTQALEDDGKRQVRDALDSVVKWLRDTDVTSPQRARQAIGVAGDLFRQLDVSSLDEMATLDLPQAIGKGSMVLAGVKQILSVYDLSVNNILDSFEAETISNDGQTATVRTKIEFLGVPYETDSEFVWSEGQWQPVEAMSTLGAVMAEEAGGMAAEPEEMQPIPSGILQFLFDDLEVALTYGDEDSFRSYWHPLTYDQSPTGAVRSGAELFAAASSGRWILKPDPDGIMVLGAGQVVPCQAWSLDDDSAVESMYALLVRHEENWVVAGVEQELGEIESLAGQFSMATGGQDLSQSDGSDASSNAESPVVSEAQIDLIDVEGMAFESLVVEPDSAGLVGLAQTLNVPDRNLLVVWMTWETTWNVDIGDITVEAEEIRLLDEQGAEHKPVGTMEARSMFRSYLSNLWIYRPSQWEDMPTQRYYWNAVFAVPGDGKTFTLKAGNQQREFLVETPVAPVYNPGWMARVEVVEAAFVDEIQGSVYAANQEFATTVRPMANKLLAVRVALTPTTGNSETREQFSWGTSWLGLINQRGHFAPAAGESDEYGGFSINTSHSVDKESGEWGTVTTTIHFVVPEETTSFELTWLGSRVASGSVAPLSSSVASEESMASESEVSMQSTDSDDAGESDPEIAAADPGGPTTAEGPGAAEEPAAAVDPQERASEEELKALIKSIQLRLSELGYDPGPADGIAGAGTRQAVRQYQGVAGLGTDGEPSAGLLDHMQSDAAVTNPLSVLPWDLDRMPLIGISTFGNDSTAPWWKEGAGEALADLFSLDLSDTGEMAVADRAAVDAVVKGQVADGRISAELRKQLAASGVDYLLKGTLQEFSQDKGGVSIAGFGFGEKEARLSFQLMLVNVATGKVVRSVSIVDTSKSGSNRLGIYKAGFDGALKDERRTAVGKAIRAAVARGGDYVECTILTPGPCS
jgi:curli biogenesis system outer membrane secretion channel CsgG